MATLSAQDGCYHMGALGQAMRKVDPGFRLKDYGLATQTKLLESLPEFALEPKQNGMYVRMAGDATSAFLQQDLCANSP